MLVEHIIPGNNVVIRETNEIDPETLELLKPFQISRGSRKVRISKMNLEIKLAVTDKGAVFDVKKNRDIAFTNICCFEEEKKDEVMKHVEVLKKLSFVVEVKNPNLTCWLYTVPINPFALSVTEMTFAEDIAFGIYHSIYLARKKMGYESHKENVSGQ